MGTAPARALEALNGRQLMPDEREDFAKHFGFKRATTETVLIHYKGERRIATDRNVDEIKAAISLQKIYLSRGSLRWYAYPLYLLVVSAQFALTHFTTRPEVLGMCVKYKCTMGFYTAPSVWAVATVPLVILSFIMITRLRKCDETVLVCPHMVACALSEFANGTGKAAAKESARLKLMRLACLPIPDQIRSQVTSGSEELVLFLVERNHFFEIPDVLNDLPRYVPPQL